MNISITFIRSLLIVFALLVGASSYAQADAVNAIQPFDLFDESTRSGGAVSFESQPKPWLVNATENWMSKLPDATQLKDISIPGTHDSGARFGLSVCQNQAWSIFNQLQAGIRYFDIRNRRTKTSFAIHHGPCFQRMMFGHVLNQIKSFLNEHPNETIIMRVKEEHSAESGSESFAQIWAGYMQNYGDLFLEDMGRLPTLGEARGKIVVLRNAGFVGYGQPMFGNADIVIQDAYKVFWLLHDNPFGSGTVSLPQKIRLIEQYINFVGSSDALTLNHLSGAVGMLPQHVARATNTASYDFIKSEKTNQKKLGLLIMDFPGEHLIYRIIKANFFGR